MSKIKPMSEALANQIAAGEVVERPASVVKELVENAIDAGSTEIQVELTDAGIQEIKVIDNGSGMSEEDLPLAFAPHATSKIYSVHDLFSIHSLGFRGEALASIGSVSKVRVESTLNHADTGHFIEIEGSKVLHTGLAKPRPGTTVIVSSLFYNTPARLKHLRTIQTELRHSLHFIQSIALAFPAIRFALYHDGKRMFLSAGTGDLQQTIANVYSPTIARQLVAVEAENEDFKLFGYVSPPTLTRTSKQAIQWFINHRPIQNYLLDNALLKAYGRQLMIGRYPVAIINIELDPQLVDVNVHPRKQTVRLSKEDQLFQLVETMIQKFLASVNPVPIADVTLFDRSEPLTTTEPVIDSIDDGSTQKNNVTHVSALTDHQIHEHDPIYQAGDNEDRRSHLPRMPKDDDVHLTMRFDRKTAVTHSDPLISDETDDAQKTIDFKALRYVGQIHGTYLIAESDSGFYMIDQHAAQERIRYEHLMRHEPSVQSQQQLLMPLLFEFTPSEALGVTNHLERLKQLGIELESFGPNSFQLNEYPTWMLESDVEKVVRELAELVIDQPDLTINQYLEAGIIMQSCRGAIKANHYLDPIQATALIQQMADLEDPYHCPHGRPVFVEFDATTIEKLFKRIQDSHQSNPHLN